MNAGTIEAYGFISFHTQGQGMWADNLLAFALTDLIGMDLASQAMEAMNGKVVGISPLQVRFHEPKWQFNFRIPSNARTNPKNKAQSKAKVPTVRSPFPFVSLRDREFRPRARKRTITSKRKDRRTMKHDVSRKRRPNERKPKS